MPPYRTLLGEALEAWEYTRAGVVDEVENLSDEQLRARPVAGARSAAELARHILENGLMMVGELTRPDGDFRRAGWQDFIAEYAGDLPEELPRGELVARLRAAQTEGDRRFREAGELHMLQTIRRFDGEPGTRLAWLHHGIAHEDYHRGQIALLARAQGVVPALTKAIQGSA